MTTYLRGFTAEQLNQARAAASHAQAHGTAVATVRTLGEVIEALNRPVNGEALCMPIVCAGWNTRAAALGLPKKDAKREQDREAYMQGAMAALVAAGLMTVERCNQLAFMTAVGRLGDYVDAQAELPLGAAA